MMRVKQKRGTAMPAGPAATPSNRPAKRANPSPHTASSPGRLYTLSADLAKKGAEAMQRARSILPFSIRTDAKITGPSFDKISTRDIASAAMAAVMGLLSSFPDTTGTKADAAADDLAISSVTLNRTRNGGAFYSFQVEGLPLDQAKWLSQHLTTTSVGGLLLHLPGWKDPVPATLTDQGPADTLFLLGISCSGSSKTLPPGFIEEVLATYGDGVTVHWVGRHKAGSISSITSSLYPDATFSTDGMAPIRSSEVDMVALVRATRAGHEWIDEGRSGHTFRGASFLIEGSTMTLKLSKRFAILPPPSSAPSSSPPAAEETNDMDTEEKEEEEGVEDLKSLPSLKKAILGVQKELEDLQHQLSDHQTTISSIHWGAKGEGSLCHQKSLTDGEITKLATSLSGKLRSASTEWGKAKETWDSFDHEALERKLEEISTALSTTLQEVGYGEGDTMLEEEVKQLLDETSFAVKNVETSFRVVMAGELGDLRNWASMAEKRVAALNNTTAETAAMEIADRSTPTVAAATTEAVSGAVGGSSSSQ